LRFARSAQSAANTLQTTLKRQKHMSHKNKNKNSNLVPAAVLDAAQPAVLDQTPAPAPEAPAPAQAELQQEVPAAQPDAAPAANSKRDAFGGRLGTRMSKINLVVIESGKAGATIAEVATATGETRSLVSSQLSWMVSRNKGAMRKVVGGKMRYYAVVNNPDQIELALS
jgi:hypothetical protein